MDAKKYEVTVRSIMGEATIEVKTSCQSKSEIGKEIEEITKAMNLDLSTIATTISPPSVIPHNKTEVSKAEVPKEFPSLKKAPYSYTPTDAVREVLNPAISNWGRHSRSVKEIQKMLVQLSVPGITDTISLDRIVRALAERGDLKREKLNGVWKYYLVPKGS